MRGLLTVAIVAALVFCCVDARESFAEMEGKEAASSQSRRELHVSDEKPLDLSEFPINPCQTNRNFNYYIAFPNDTSRFIQCDPWGTAVVKTCEEGLIWDTWTLCCKKADEITKSVLVIPERVFNCSMSGSECLNGGVCTESELGGDRCVCKPEWTGPKCESAVDQNDLVHMILNSTFSLDHYRIELAKLNVTVEPNVYMRYKDLLDNSTFEALMDYIGMYEKHEVRYDTLINNLVSSILEDMYPDAFFLSTFNATKVNVVEILQLIPNMMSYTKYSLERYQEVFARYQLVLEKLFGYLKSEHPELKKEASQYSHLTSIFMKETLLLSNQSAELEAERESMSRKPSKSELSQTLRTEFNSTLVATQQLFKGIENFQIDVLDLIKKNSTEAYSLCLGKSKLNGTGEIIKMFKQISSSSIQIWEQLVDYGFWYLTSQLCPSLIKDIKAEISKQ